MVCPRDLRNGVDVIPGCASVAGDAPSGVKTVFGGEYGRQNAVVITIAAAEVQGSQRRLERVFSCNIARIADVMGDEVENRPQFAHVVPGRTFGRDLQAGLPQPRIPEATIR